MRSGYKRFIGIVIVMSVVLCGCKKQEPVSETVAGTYRLNRTPMYCEFEASDPGAVALTVDGTEMTYASINGMIMLLLGQVVCNENIDITFQTGGTVSIDRDGDTIVPDAAEGISSEALTYRIVDEKIRLSVGREIMIAVMHELGVDSSEYVSETVELNVVMTLDYVLNNGQLSLYLDKNSVAEALDVFQNLFEYAGDFVGDDTLLSTLAAVIPQLKPALDGYRKFNVGVVMKRI